MSNVLVSLSPISTPTQASKLKLNLNNFIVRTSSYEKDSLDKQVARFFFSSNLSFNSVEGSEFQKLCSLLRPGYIPQNRKKLGEELLDDVYNDLSIKISKELENKATLIICQDGWSSVQDYSIIAHSVYDKKKAVKREMGCMPQLPNETRWNSSVLK